MPNAHAPGMSTVPVGRDRNGLRLVRKALGSSSPDKYLCVYARLRRQSDFRCSRGRPRLLNSGSLHLQTYLGRPCSHLCSSASCLHCFVMLMMPLHPRRDSCWNDSSSEVCQGAAGVRGTLLLHSADDLDLSSRLSPDRYMRARNSVMGASRSAGPMGIA